MAYLADPGGRFASDVHRRVLGHLSTPRDTYGWTVVALLHRMRPDVGTSLQTPDEVAAVLEELHSEGLAQPTLTEGGEVWRMTQDGFDLLTGSIANEPPADAKSGGPALIGTTNGATGATEISKVQES